MSTGRGANRPKARRVAEPAGHASLGPFRTVELALSADLASAVGDADVFARALDALSKIAPQGLAADLRAVADLATRDLRGPRRAGLPFASSSTAW